MRADIRRKLSMAAGALDLAVAHPSPDVSYNTLVGRLKERLARADHLVMQQASGRTGELPLATEDCVKMTKLLDGLYRIRFKDDPESLIAWEHARNVVVFNRAKKGDVPVPVAPAVSPPA
jgi:hypothetical protein